MLRLHAVVRRVDRIDSGCVADVAERSGDLQLQAEAMRANLAAQLRAQALAGATQQALVGRLVLGLLHIGVDAQVPRALQQLVVHFQSTDLGAVDVGERAEIRRGADQILDAVLVGAEGDALRGIEARLQAGFEVARFLGVEIRIGKKAKKVPLPKFKNQLCQHLILS